MKKIFTFISLRLMNLCASTSFCITAETLQKSRKAAQATPVRSNSHSNYGPQPEE